MDADNQPIHERRISKLSGWARKLKQLDNRVATVGPNHPALATSCTHGPATKNAMSAPLGVQTSPCRTLDASTINPLALFTQQACAAVTTEPFGPVILNLEEALVNESKAKALSDESVSSEMSTNKAGDDNPNKGITSTGGVEQPFAPLPDDYSFTYSATGDKPPGDDDDELDEPVDLCDEEVSKFTFIERLAHYMDGHKISNRNRKAVELAIFAEAGTYVRGLDPMKRPKQEDAFMRKYMQIITSIEDDQFENDDVREAMLLNYKGSKKGGSFTGATVYRKQETEINNIRKFAAKFPGVNNPSQLPSGSTQVRDMKKPYIIRLWKMKHPVS